MTVSVYINVRGDEITYKAWWVGGDITDPE